MALQSQDEKQMGMFLHLSQLATLFFPLGGLIAPIVFWQIKKDEMPALDAHGKMVTNWVISSVIYSVVCGVLIESAFFVLLLLVRSLIFGGFGCAI